MVKLGPHQSLSTISFDYIEPVKLDVILHMGSLYPQLKLHIQPFHLKLVTWTPIHLKIMMDEL